MKKIAVIHQPDFIPYLGFFHRLLQANVLIFLDHVQFSRGGSNSWTHRDKIKTTNGPKWLTLPIEKCSLATPINKVLISGKSNWRKQHLEIIKENYKNSPFFEFFYPKLEKMYAFPSNNMAEFNINSIKTLLETFNINITIEKSSSMNPSNSSNEMLADLLETISATHYLSGIGAKDYYESRPFTKRNIQVSWQKFKHPVYTQQHNEFVEYLSSIDIFFNENVDQARKILRAI